MVAKNRRIVLQKIVLHMFSFAMAEKAILTGIAMTLAAAAALAQIAPLTSDIMRPIPGAGHDYVKGLNETVNPANGSLNISIQPPALTSRGMTMPFSIVYNSGSVHHLKVEEYSGGTSAKLLQDGPGLCSNRSLDQRVERYASVRLGVLYRTHTNGQRLQRKLRYQQFLHVLRCTGRIIPTRHLGYLAGKRLWV